VKLSERPLAFVDVETTGLDPSRHEVIEVAVVFDDYVFRRVGAPWAMRLRREEPDVAMWHTRIRPERIGDADPKALAVNRYDPARWADAPTASEVADDIVALLTRDGADPIIVGHNVSFDRDFLNALLRSTGHNAKVSHHTVDTVTLCYEHLVPCGLEWLSLDNVRRFMGIPTEGSHSALKDAIDARELYRRLIRASVPERALWRMRGRRRVGR
jgi:DNA polymerase III subunit epsilon